jgi:hypothetical protein
MVDEDDGDGGYAKGGVVEGLVMVAGCQVDGGGTPCEFEGLQTLRDVGSVLGVEIISGGGGGGGGAVA